MDSGMDSGGSEEALNEIVDFPLVLHAFSEDSNSEVDSRRGFWNLKWTLEWTQDSKMLFFHWFYKHFLMRARRNTPEEHPRYTRETPAIQPRRAPL